MKSINYFDKTKVSFWQIFRIIFVIFSLYLLRDVFFRWDGFRYYASFSEFLPSVALVTILWTFLAVLTSIIALLLLRSFEWICLQMRLTIKAEHLLLFIAFSVLLAAMAWIGKRIIWHNISLPFVLKYGILLCLIILSIYLTWYYRKKPGILSERITPLVWLFGIWFIFSFPLVGYHTWLKQTNNVPTQEDPQSAITDMDLPNIILVTFDTLTARDMSVYGYGRPTTPFISKWAKTASLFTKLEAESNITSPTTASLMTGKRVWTHQTYHVGNVSEPVKSKIENLALILKQNDYYNMAFVANRAADVKLLGISESFDIAKSYVELTLSFPRGVSAWFYRLFGSKIRLYDWIIRRDFILGKLYSKIITHDFSETRRPPKMVFDNFLTAIDDNPPEPFFAWIHLMPPHNPYLPPKPFMGMYNSSSRHRSMKSQIFPWLETLEFNQEQQPIVDILRARYDEFIRYCDKQFEDFIGQLTVRNILKNTVVILSSDHGESFEHGYITHDGKHLYEQVTHLPLIIKEPDQTEGQIINDLVEQIDIPATILGLANIPVPSWMEGRSLVPLMRGKGLQPRPAFSMALQKNRSLGHQINKGTIAVWERDYKLIYYLEENKSLLFNLKQDPDELNNIFDKEPEQGQILLTLIKNNLKKANIRISRGE